MSGGGESKWGAMAGGDEKGRGVVALPGRGEVALPGRGVLARQVSGEKVPDCSLSRLLEYQNQSICDMAYIHGG